MRDIFPTLWYFGIIYIILASQVCSQRQPRNITRAAGETDVFIPCPFEFSLTPSIWRISGIDFTTATIPTTLYSLTPGGLFINTVLVCMNQTSYQCIDTSEDALQEQVSEIGYLTVTSIEICPDGGQEELLLDAGRADLELDHLNTVYGHTNITLAWTIVPPHSGCNISRILSYYPCEQSSPDINETIDDTSITIPSVNLSIGGQLADFAISSLSDQESLDCPRLPGTVRFNVTKTEQVNLLLGNNNCTSVPMKRRGGLGFAISNQNPDEVDITCSIYAPANQCYSPDACTSFDTAPFFRICEDPSSNAYNLLFDSVTRQQNGTRLDFFITTKTLCPTSPVYFTRTYVRSFELIVTITSSDTTINITSREICFNSQSTDCNLTVFTLYHFSVVDISNNTIFEMDNIPESTCLLVDQLGLLPQCGPFMATTRPFNDYIMYDAERQQIRLDTNEISTDEPNICSCLKATTQLQLTTEYNLPESLLEVNYQCSTVYATPIQITISDSSSPRFNFTDVTTCSEGRIEFNIGRDLCGIDFTFCGFFTFENGSVLNFADCALNCSTVSVVCPTTPNTGPTPTPSPDVIIGVVVSFILILIVTIIILGVITAWCIYRYRRPTVAYQEELPLGQPPPEQPPPEQPHLEQPHLEQPPLDEPPLEQPQNLGDPAAHQQ